MDSYLMEIYRNYKKIIKIYDKITKDHKGLLKQHDNNSNEYKELKKLIVFVKKPL